MYEISSGATYALQKLRKNGYEAYIVGGAVRDLLRGVCPNDYDMTTSALPTQMKEVFKDDKILETGIAHGTLTLCYGKENVEITTYRTDGDYTDNRHPDRVTFSRSLKEDLSRRDFTVNAFAYDGEKTVVDCFNGRADLENKILRAIGVPEQRFTEDALRILRGVRFASCLGFTIEEQTKRAMTEKKELLKNVSKERIATEINGFLLGDYVGRALLENEEIIAKIVPLANVSKIAKRLNDSEKNRLIRLAVLLQNEENAKTYLTTYRYDNATKKSVLLLLQNQGKTFEDDFSVKTGLFTLGKELFLTLLSLQGAKRSTIQRAKQIAENECYRYQDLALNGNDLLALGFCGAQIKETLSRFLVEVMKNNVPNQKEILLKMAKEQRDELSK